MAVMDIEAAKSLKVVDLGTGFGGLLVATHFADLGAQVTRLVPSGPDPFDTLYPIHSILRGAQASIDTTTLEAALAEADICIIGGEDFPDSPELPDAAALASNHPQLVVLEMSGGVDADGESRPAVDLLAQARTGLAFDQLGDRPFAWPLPMPTFGMALQGLIGSWAALLARERTGQGQIVRVSMQEGAAFATAPDRLRYEHQTIQTERVLPRGVRQLILRCADGRYVQFAKQAGMLARIYTAFGIPFDGDPATLDLREPAVDPRDFFGNYDLFSEWALKWNSQELLEALWKAGIPADRVLVPGECWTDEQVAANGILRERDRGTRSVGFPIRFRRTSGAIAPSVVGNVEPRAAPLAGLKVLGLGAFIAGPCTGRGLADLGADVIKVDALGGDPAANTYGHWWACNSGKRSLRLNLKTPEGIEALHKLCSEADVVHHNFRPGVAARLGIDPASLRERRAGTCTVECSAYGSTGPKAEMPGFDQIAMGITGNEIRAGGEGNDPVWYRNCIADYTAGALGTIGALIALYERAITGDAVDAEVNLLNAALYLMFDFVQLADGSFVGAPGNDAAQLGPRPFERCYQTADGWIAIAARGGGMQDRLCVAVGIDPLAIAGEAVSAIAAIERSFAPLTTGEALRRLGEANVWAERCVDMVGLAMDADPAAAAAGLVRTYSDPELGEVVGTGPLLRLSASVQNGPGRAPLAGEHSRAILAELNLDAAEIQRYFDNGIAA
jgi:crotonobetainyl-CoA:carnitine CoA-transferase CaiB-like acyl-CoA transferase